MERNRETRRAWISSSNGVNTRRQNRTHTLRENPDGDEGFELQESARLRRERVRRDRERKRERRRDFRERSKRRRGGDESSDEEEDDDDDDDEDEDEETTATATATATARLFPPLRRKSFPLGSPVWKPGDETIASSVPRKPRSASTKRSRDWISSRSSAVNGGAAEQILRQASSSPATQNGVVSSSFLKKKLKPSGNDAGASPSISKQNSSNPEKLEIEIAEVLFGLMNQSQGSSTKKENCRSNRGPKSSPVSGSGAPQAVAPKRKRQSRAAGNPARPGPVETDQAPKSEVLSPHPEKVFSGEVVGNSVVSHVREETVITEDVADERESGAVKNDGNFCSDSPSIATASSTSVVFDTMIKVNSTAPEVEIQRKEEIDLMAPLPLDSILSTDDVVCSLPADESEESKRKKEFDNCERKIGLHFDLETPEITENTVRQQREILIKAKIEGEPLPSTSWSGGVPAMGCISSVDCGPTVSPSPIQLLQPSFTQPRPKRCATHCYIARNVHCLQQLAKMNPVWQATAGPATFSESKPCNLNVVPSDPIGNVDPKASFLDSAQRKQQMLLQQALPPVGPSSSTGPTIMFPLNHQQVATAAALARPISPTPPSTTNPSPSAGASTTAMSFNYPPMAAINEPQYLAILQNQGYPFPRPSVAPAPNYWGPPPGQAVPCFNGSFYPSQMIHSSQIQHHQTPSAQPCPNSSALHGPSSTEKNFIGQQPSRPDTEAKPGSAPTQKPQQLFQSNTRPRHLDIWTGREGSPTTTVDSGRGSCPFKSIHGPNITLPVHPHQPHQFAMSFGTINGSNSTDISSNHQNLAIFQSLPEATRQNIQMIAAAGASQAAQSINDNNFRISESRKSVGMGSSTNDASNVTESSGWASNVSSGAAIRSSQPVMNLNAHDSHQGQLQQQQMVMNRSISMAQSPQWKNYSRTPVSPAPSSLASSTLTSLKNPHSRPPTQTHNQISFGGNSKPSTNSQGQPPASPSNSSVSKGSSRTTSSTSTNTKAGQSSIFSAQQSKKLHSNSSQKSPSILGNPTPMQPHMFFSNPYPQAQSPHSNSAGSATSGPNGFYMQPIPARPNQHHQTSSSTGNVKGGRLISQGITHTSHFGRPVVGGTLLPASFSYVQLKPAEQK